MEQSYLSPMYVRSSLIAEYDQPCIVANSARGRLNRDQLFLPYLGSRLTNWSLEKIMGSAVSSRVSMPILHTQAESIIVLYHGIPPFSAAASFIYTVSRHRVCPEFIG